MFNRFLRDCSLIFVRFQPTTIRRSNSNGSEKKIRNSSEETSLIDKIIRDGNLSNITVTSFYSQTAIEQWAQKVSTRLTPLTMMYIGKTEDGGHLLRSAKYLHQDLPIRFAHRIDDFRHLPFVVACNPLLLELHERFIKIFHALHSFPTIQNLEQEKTYTELLGTIVKCTSDTLPMLAEGFRESRRYIKQDALVTGFLDRALTARLAIKMLVEHHLKLRVDRPNYVGAICMSFSPREFVQTTAESLQKLFLSTYGRAPEVKIQGHVQSSFPYMAIGLNYIVREILKNAFRATVDYHRNSKGKLPEIVVTISVTADDLILRISDRAGGMTRNLLNQIFDYHFTSNPSSNVDNDRTNQISGYGFGIPTARAYCEYLNGSLMIETMLGVGTDVYIRLGLLTAENRILRL